jgi:hypothetical protein
VLAARRLDAGEDAHRAGSLRSPCPRKLCRRGTVPKEIINRKGRLNDDDWKLMKLHTLDGERMLRRVGGELTEVGSAPP